MSNVNAAAQYTRALKAGNRYVHKCLARGEYPYPQVLDEIVDEANLAGRVDLGIMEIPCELIIGTRTRGRKMAFAGNFMPLLEEDSEFHTKWVSLCRAHLSDEGIRDPITCFEYLGRFYVQEGNKRTSVLMSFGAASILGHVTRLVPTWSDDEGIRAYYAFMDFYRSAKTYQIQFSRAEDYSRLKALLGLDPKEEWSEDTRADVLSNYLRFREIYEGKFHNRMQHVPAAEALLIYLEVYSYAGMKDKSLSALEREIEALQPEFRFVEHDEPVEVLTEPDSVEPGFVRSLISGVIQPRLNVAFVHGVDPTKSMSGWTHGHNLGREYLENRLGDRVQVQTYIADPTSPDDAMEQAVADGAQLMIITAPTLIAACRRIAALHPEVKVLVCALSLPMAGVRTYYSRIYEAKFITGAIAGAVSETDRIGYIARYPILGVPAAINAFALGARMTNPNAQIQLEWTCLQGNPFEAFAKNGVRVISNRENAAQESVHQGIDWGTYRIDADGVSHPLSSAVWNWGRLYKQFVLGVMNGSWEAVSRDNGSSVNYWWGMDSGVIDVHFAEELPAGVRQMAEILRSGLCGGAIHPFMCRFSDQTGILRNDGTKNLTPEEIMHMDYLCENVIGRIPEYGELLPMAQNMTRLLGLHRNGILQETEELS